MEAVERELEVLDEGVETTEVVNSCCTGSQARV